MAKSGLHETKLLPDFTSFNQIEALFNSFYLAFYKISKPYIERKVLLKQDKNLCNT